MPLKSFGTATDIGNNYIKGLCALAFQGFFIMVCVGIYSVLVASVAVAGNLHTALWSVAAYAALPKQISWRLVRFIATFVLMPLKSFGTATDIAISISKTDSRQRRFCTLCFGRRYSRRGYVLINRLNLLALLLILP